MDTPTKNIYWRDIPKDAPVTDAGHVFIARGAVVFWEGHEAVEAQRSLKARSKSTKPLEGTQLEDARMWLMDIYFTDITPEDIEEMSAEEITKAVERHYDGGVWAFLKDGDY